MSIKRALLILSIAALALATTAPADAQLQGKQFEVDHLGIQIGSPFHLVYVSFDCVDFVSARVVCFRNSFEDCGPYEITSVEGTTIHFTAQLEPDLTPQFKGRMTVRGTVDRGGRGSSLSFSFDGRLASSQYRIRPTTANGSGHGVQGCQARKVPAKPLERWMRYKRR